MKDKLRIGAIGGGYWGPNLIRNFIEIPDAELVAVADLDEGRLNHLKSRFPQIQTTTQNYKDFFEMDLDGVVIATPPNTHFPIAADCMNNNLSVLVEKPLTLNSEDARNLISVAAQNNVVLMVGHTFEYNPAVRQLKSMIDSGELGDIYYIDAVRASLGLFQTKANVLWDLAPHDISILRYLLGNEPYKVSVHSAACVQEGIHDVAYAAFRFPNNVMAHIRMSWLDPSKTRKITVVGSKKMVIYDDVENLEKIRIYDKGVKAIRHTDTFGEFSFAYHYGDVVIPHLQMQEPLRVQCSHFLECVKEGKTPQTDGYNGLSVVNILEAAQKSLEQDGDGVEISNMIAQSPSTNGKVSTD
ncbi:MAG: Gfo/Idh/MocA family oxidoreductase [Chloroflexota bacterium]